MSACRQSAVPLRQPLGALIIQKRMGLSDRALVKAIAENPYYQYFIGLASFSVKCPFTYSTLSLFRRRISAEMLMAANESFLKDSPSTPEHRDAQPGGGRPRRRRRLARTASRKR